MGNLRDFHIKAGHVNPDANQPVECKCGWKGVIVDCNRNKAGEYDAPLAQRKGWFWHCPVCDTILWHYWYAVS